MAVPFTGNFDTLTVSGIASVPSFILTGILTGLLIFVKAVSGNPLGIGAIATGKIVLLLLLVSGSN